jgi:hypothetical protein
MSNKYNQSSEYSKKADRLSYKEEAARRIESAKKRESLRKTREQLPQTPRAAHDPAAQKESFAKQQSGVLPMDPEARKESWRKAQNRVSFQARIAETLPPGFKNRAQIAPILCLDDNNLTRSFEQRLDIYSSKHKCSHGASYNLVDTFPRTNPKFIIPQCDHQYEYIGEPCDGFCYMCGSTLLKVYRICGCEAVSCSHCRRRFYKKTDTWSTLACGCDLKACGAQWSIDHDTPLFSNEAILNWKHPDHVPVKQLNFQQWSQKHLVTSLKKKKEQPKTFAQMLKVKSEPLEVVPEGGIQSIVSSLTSTAATTYKSIIDSVKEFVTKLKNFILDSTVAKALKSYVNLSTCFCVFMDLINACLDIVEKKSILENIMWFSCLTGTPTQRTVAWLELVIQALGRVADTFVEDAPKGSFLYHFCEVAEWTTSLNAPVKELFQQLDNKVRAANSYFYEKNRNKEFKPKYESGADFVAVENESLGSLCTFISSLFPTKYATQMLKTASFFAKDILPLLNVTKVSLDLSSKFYNWILKVLGFWTEDTRSWLVHQCQDKDSIVAKVLSNAILHQNNVLMDRSEESAISLVKLQESLNLVTQYFQDENRLDPHTMQFLRQVQTYATLPLPARGREHEPFCVRLFGPPGAGKSRAVATLFGPLVGAKDKKTFDQHTFYRGDSEFWDGVVNRSVIVYDDFGQDISTETNLKELISLISCGAFMANFANIAGRNPKGISIDPKVVVCCSNIGQDQAKQLLDHTALSRRFHLKIMVEKDKGYRVAGGSLISDNLSVMTDFMTLEDCRMYIYNAYSAFRLSRQTGVDTETAAMSAWDFDKFPALVSQSDVKKIRTPDFTSFPKQNLRLNLARSHPLYVPDVEQEGWPSPTMDFTQMISDVANCCVTTYSIALFGANLYAGFSFFASVPGSNARRIAHILKAALIPALVGVSLGLYYYFSRPTVEPESSVAKGKTPNKSVMVEGGAQAVTEVQSILEKSTIRIRHKSTASTVNGIFIGGRSILTVHHIFVPLTGSDTEYPDGTLFELHSPLLAQHLDFKFKKENLKILTLDGSENTEVDACLYTLEKSESHCYRKIVSKFWHGDELIHKQPALLLDYTAGTTKQIWKESTVNTTVSCKYSQAGKKWVLSLLRCTHSSSVGSCGSPLMLATGTTNSPILGIHVASDPIARQNGEPGALVLPITQAMIKRAFIEEFDPPRLSTKHANTEIDVNQELGPYQFGNLRYYGNMARPIYVANKTALHPSPLYDKIVEHTTEPAILTPRDIRNPDPTLNLYTDGMRKTSAPFRCDPQTNLQVRNDMLEEYRRYPTTAPQQPLDWDTILHGNPYLNGVDLSTSPGYPFSIDGVKKSELFVRNDDQKIQMKRPLLEQIYRDLLAIKQRIVPDWIFMSSLKDERRPIEKVRITPKTRFFTVCPIVFNLLEKAIFGPFMWKVMENGHKFPFAGGIDRLGASWHPMFLSLKSTSPFGFGGDYRCFDGSICFEFKETSFIIMVDGIDLKVTFHIPPQFVTEDAQHLCDLINSLGLSYQEIYDAIVLASLYPLIAVLNWIFQNIGSILSGEWVTSIGGSLCGEQYLRHGWYHLAPPGYKTGFWFNISVKSKIMSDDNINAVTKSASAFFNGKTFSDFLASRNVTYTSADKKGDAADIEPLEEISFLKNKTKRWKNFYVPIMEYSAAVEPINWIRPNKSYSNDDLCSANCNAALRAIFYHSKREFEHLRSSILKYKPEYSLLDYNTLYHQFITYGGFPGFQPGEFAHAEIQGELPTNTTMRYDSNFREDLEVFSVTPESGRFESLKSIKTLHSRPIESDGDGKMRCFHCGEPLNEFWCCCNSFQRDLPLIYDLFYCKWRPMRNSDFKLMWWRDRKIGLISPDNVPYYWNHVLIDCVENYQVIELTESESEFIGSKFILELQYIDDEFDEVFNYDCPHYFWLAIDPKIFPGYIDIIMHNPYECTSVYLGSDKYYISVDDRLLEDNNTESVQDTKMTKTSYKLSEPQLDQLYKAVGVITTIHKRLIKDGVSIALINDINRTAMSLTSLKVDLLNSLDLSSPPAPCDPDSIFDILEPVPVNQESGVDTAVGMASAQSAPSTETPLSTNISVKATLGDPTAESSTSDNKQGFTIESKGNMDMSTVHPVGSKFIAPRAEKSLNDRAWDLESILSRWHQVATIPWPTTSAPGTVLWKADVINGLLTTSFAGTPFRLFEEMRCSTVEVYAMVVGSGFHQGRALLGFIPTMCPAASTSYAVRPTGVDLQKKLILLGGSQLDPGEGTRVQYTVPFRHPKGWLNLLTDDCLGQMYLCVHSQLQASTGASTDVLVKIFFRLVDTEFKVPRVSTTTYREEREFYNRAAQRTVNLVNKPLLVDLESGPQDITAKNSATIKAQASINGFGREGSYIAPVRAKTGDPKIPTFGEVDPDLRNWCKRYVKVQDDSVTITDGGASRYLAIDMNFVMSSFWPLSMYSMYRGSVNFKVFSHAVDANRGPLHVRTSAFLSSCETVDTPAENINLINANDNALASTFGLGQETCLEFQIPHLSPSAANLNPIMYNNGTSSQDVYSMYDDRVVWIQQLASILKGEGAMYLKIYVSLADEFGAGVFIGNPRNYYIGGYPGKWPPVPGAKLIKKRPRHDVILKDGKLVPSESRTIDVVQEAGIFAKAASAALNAVAEEIEPESVIGDLIGFLDKPAISAQPQWMIPKLGGYLNFAAGPESLDRLTLHPAHQTLIDAEHFGTDASEMHLDHLFARKSYVGRFSWPTTALAGDLLYSEQVGPMFDVQGGRYETLSLLTYISKNFQFWRGGITFLFDVVTSRYHEGRLDISYHPNAAGAPTDYNFRNSQYAATVSVRNTENAFAVTFPYLGELPWRQVYDGDSYNERDATASPPNISNYYNGTFAVSVGAPLRVPNNVAPQVDVLVYVLPADDFQLAHKGFNGFRIQNELPT